jgi:hypothetical protein
MLLNRKQSAAFFGLLLFGSLSVAAQTSPAKIDVAKLIRSAQLNGELMSKRIFEYSWKSKTLVRQFKRARLQKEMEQVHEVYPAPGIDFVVQKLVSENGLPLSAKRAAKEQKHLEEELLRAEITQAAFSEETTATANRTGCPTFGIWTVLNATGGTETSLGISDFLCFATFFSPRIERKDGRDIVILLFRPREGLIPPAREKTPFTKFRGVMWIDLKDQIVTHVEAWLVNNLEGAETVPSGPPPIVFDDMRLADGMWVRRSRYINTRKDPLAFNGLNLEWKQEFSKYQRYSTELRGFQIEEPKASIGVKPPASKQ